MKRSLLALAALALAAGAAQADTNVALGGTVTLSATAGFGNAGGWCCSAPADPSTVTDGVLLPLGQQWNIGTVFWGGSFNTDTVFIQLPTLSQVSSITLQADNNDDYGIRYEDNAGVWHDLVTISPHRSWGMDMGSASFGPVVAQAFSITNVGGDGLASVSEFQAMGTPVPEPESYALMLAGLGAMGFMARRRKAR